MDIRIGSVVILVSFLCVLVIGRSAEGRTRAGDFSIGGSSLEIDADMWEQLQSKCRLDFLQMAGAYGLFIDDEMFIEPQKMRSKEATSTKICLQNVISALPPHLKQTLLDCLQKENIPFHVSGEEDGTKKWYVRYLESFFGWHDPSRRQLDENSLQGDPPILDPASPPAALPSFQLPSNVPETTSGIEPNRVYKPSNAPEPPAGLAPTKASEPNLESNNVVHPQPNSASAGVLEPQKEVLGLSVSEPKKSAADPLTKSSPPNTELRKEPSTAESSPPNAESRKEPSTAESSPPNTDSNKKPSTAESNSAFQPQQLDSASTSILEPQEEFLGLSESEPEKPTEDPSTKSSPPNTESKEEPSTTESSPPSTESRKEPSTAESSPPNSESKKEPSTAKSSPPNTESRKEPSTAESSPPNAEANKKPSTGSHPPATPDSAPQEPTKKHHVVPVSATPDSAPQEPTKKHHVVPVSVAIGVTASGAFIFGLVLFCFSQKRTYRQGYEEKDDNPLLTLSLRSSSFDASRKSTLGGVTDKEKLGSTSFGSSTNQSVKSSSLNRKLSTASDISSVHEDSSLSENAGAAALSQESSGTPSNHGLPVRTSSLLKPPPGRSNPPPPGPANPPPPPPPGNVNPPPPPGAANPPPPPGLAGPRAPGPPPPPPAGRTSGAPPPPPPKGATAPRPPQPFNGKPSPYRRNAPGNNGRDEKSGAQDGSESRKQKLKPFFWDKVLANPDQSMVWDQIRSGSFQFDEEMIENLFGCTTTTNKKEKKKGASSQETRQFIQILDAKKGQNISILLKALNVTIEEVNDALHEGNELPVELLQTLLKMAPTEQEELKLRLYSGEMSQLGPAERFLKVVVDIPFAFKRMDSLLFKKSLQEEVISVKESLATLEVASKELKNSRLFLKLLEAVLKTGNRMNDGTFRGGAQAFKLDTLLKLADVKGADGKITLLHFVVQEIIRSEGKRAARTASEGQDLPIGKSQELEIGDFAQDTENYYRSLGLEVVSGLGGELQNVKKAAGLDSDAITGTVSKLGHGLMRTKNFLNTDMKDTEEDSGFCKKLKSFVEHAESEIMWLLEEEKRIMAMVKSTVDYFHGSTGKDEGLRLFVIVRDFLSMLDRACAEVRKSTPKVQKKETKTATTPGHKKSLSEIKPASPTSSSHKKSLSVSRTPSLDFQAITD